MAEPQSNGHGAKAVRRQKGRSPSYPGISLRVAVERARAVYEKARRHSLPMSAITEIWGFKSHLTGPASVSYAALKKFGLLDEEGSGDQRVARLSPLAMDILLKPDPSDAIRQAALRPPIHREMWEEYGDDLPPNETLRWRLVAQRAFTETGYEEFLREYRDTIAFAQLVSPPSGGEDVADEDEAPSAVVYPATSVEASTLDRAFGIRSQMSPAAPQPMPPGTLRIPVRLIGGSAVFIEGPFPISEADWAHLLAVLQAMKPGLVTTPPEMGDGGVLKP